MLDRFRRNGLTAKPSKCEIGHAEHDLLGHVLGGGSIKPQDKKLDKILNMRRPVTKNALRSFLGTIGNYQKFIDNYANKAKPLTDRLKKGEANQVRWDEESSGVVEALPRELIQKPILKLPNFRKQFELRTDESDGGMGVVLSQEHDGMNMPVMYVSRKLREAETQQLNASVWGCSGQLNGYTFTCTVRNSS